MLDRAERNGLVLVGPREHERHEEADAPRRAPAGERVGERAVPDEHAILGRGVRGEPLAEGEVVLEQVARLARELPQVRRARGEVAAEQLHPLAHPALQREDEGEHGERDRRRGEHAAGPRARLAVLEHGSEPDARQRTQRPRERVPVIGPVAALRRDAERHAGAPREQQQARAAVALPEVHRAHDGGRQEERRRRHAQREVERVEQPPPHAAHDLARHLQVERHVALDEARQLPLRGEVGDRQRRRKQRSEREQCGEAGAAGHGAAGQQQDRERRERQQGQERGLLHQPDADDECGERREPDAFVEVVAQQHRHGDRREGADPGVGLRGVVVVGGVVREEQEERDPRRHGAGRVAAHHRGHRERARRHQREVERAHRPHRRTGHRLEERVDVEREGALRIPRVAVGQAAVADHVGDPGEDPRVPAEGPPQGSGRDRRREGGERGQQRCLEDPRARGHARNSTPGRAAARPPSRSSPRSP